MKFKLFYLLFFSINILSCTSQKKVIESSELTEELFDYYNYWLRYPVSTEQYCHDFYKRDSINSFEFISEFIKEDDVFSIKSYSQYMNLFDSFAKTCKYECYEYAPKFYLLKYRYQISFNNMDSVLCVNNIHKNVLVGLKLTSFLPYFDGMLSIESYPIDIRKCLRKIERFGLYSDNLMRLEVSEDKLEELQNCFSQYFRYHLAMNRKESRKYVVLYGRDGTMKDVIADRAIPENIKEDVVLKQYLNDVLNTNCSAFYVKFCVTI